MSKSTIAWLPRQIGNDLYRYPGDGDDSQHHEHVDDDAIGVARGGADKNVLHQPAVFFRAGLEPRHRAAIDQRRINSLAALELFQEIERPEADALVLDINGRAIIGLEGVFCLELDQLVGPDELEVCTQ